MLRFLDKHTSRKAFTLVEIMVVVLIIGTLIGLAVPRFKQARIKAQVATYLADRKIIAEAVEIYRLRNNGADPTSRSQSVVDSALYPYISSKFQGNNPRDPFGGSWYTWNQGASDYGFTNGIVVNPGNTSFHIAATTPSNAYAQEIMKYMPKDGSTCCTANLILYFL